MSHTVTSAPATEDADFVAELLARSAGRDVRVASLTREPSPFATLFPADVLSVILDDGRRIRLFVKHFGEEQSDQPDKRRRDREVRAYEELLNDADADLPVVRYFGSRPNENTRRRELYLEYVDDWALRYHDLEHWFTAAERLADLHGHFATRAARLRESDFLLRLDDSYFVAWGERASAAVAGQSSELADRVARLLERYAAVAVLLARQPPTLVHNDLACKNVIADRSASPARICIVDWELAGVGCGLLDLVHLRFGLDRASAERMLESYRARLGSTHLLPTDKHDLARLLAACELHKTLYRLAHSPAWKLPIAEIARWVDEAELFSQTAVGP